MAASRRVCIASAAAFLACGLLCAGTTFAVIAWLLVNSAHHASYTHAEFNSTVIGASESEIRAVLGAPDKVIPFGEDDHWEFDGRTRDEDTGKADASAMVWFYHGRCERTSFTP